VYIANSINLNQRDHAISSFVLLFSPPFFYIFTPPPAMQAHDHVVKDLNEEFKKVDRAFETNEVRVFGKFKHLLIFLLSKNIN
jgi:hypothetical protein